MIAATSDNLIPLSRRDAREARARLRGWAAVWVVLGMLGAVAIVVALGARDQGPRASDAEWSSVEARHTASQARLTLLRADAARVSERRATVEQIGTHPDWSVVLALISRRMGSGIALSSVEILPAAKPVPEGYTIAISGSGIDQSAVATFVLGLEQVGVFDTVSLRQSRREGLGPDALVLFDIECVAREGS